MVRRFVGECECFGCGWIFASNLAWIHECDAMNEHFSGFNACGFSNWFDFDRFMRDAAHGHTLEGEGKSLESFSHRRAILLVHSMNFRCGIGWFGSIDHTHTHSPHTHYTHTLTHTYSLIHTHVHATKTEYNNYRKSKNKTAHFNRALFWWENEDFHFGSSQMNDHCFSYSSTRWVVLC